MHEDDRESDRIAVERAVAERSDYRIEYRIAKPGGALSWIEAHGKLSFDAKGRPERMAGVCMDITSRKQTEEALRDETRILELLNRTGNGARRRTSSCKRSSRRSTDAATELSGAQFGAFFYNTTSADGDAFMLYTLSGAPREAFEKFGQPRATPLFGPTFNGGSPIRCDDVLDRSALRQDGPASRHAVRPSARPQLPRRAGRLALGRGDRRSLLRPSRAGVFTERTERLVVGIAAQAAVAIDNARLYESAQRAAEERKQLLESERAARAAAERVSDMKDEFLATLSHELRTPLSAILGWAHILRRGAKSEADLHNGLDTIERNARVQTQLIEDLLDMSRITSGKVRLDIQPVAPGGLHRGRDRHRASRGGREGHPPREVARPGRRSGLRRPQPAAAGRLEPALQRDQVHAEGRQGRRSS